MTLVCLAHYSTLSDPAGVTVWRREADAGATGVRKLLAIVGRSCRLAWRARGFDRVVLVTAGVELFVLAALLPRRRVVAVDWLMPRGSWLDRSWPLSRVGRFVVVRRSDIPTLARRFGVPPDRCDFVPFPVTTAATAPPQDQGYYYSAGWAHRDWDTLIAALAEVGVDALLSMPSKPLTPPTVRVVPQFPPEEGRQWMLSARCVVLSFHDTDLPSGPLVLIDALAHGKPVIVTDVGGSRDYVQDGVNALMVPPGDQAALAAAIRRMDADPGLRSRLGDAARVSVASLTEQDFWAGVLSRTTEGAGSR